MSALWSGQQHHWLQALGHHVYVQGALAPEPVAAVGVARPAARTSVRSARSQSPAAPAPRPVRGSGPRPSGNRVPDKLHIALIRASGCNPNAPGSEQLMAAWPSPAQLRGNAAAKRALWPRLRSLRRPQPA